MADARDRVSVAFTELAGSVMPEVRLPGVEAAHDTVRRRRRRRLTVLTAAVAVVLLAPAGAIALLRGYGDGGPDIGGTPAAPSATASATPSVTGSPQPAGLRAIRDSNVREETPLDDAVLPIPSFGPAAGGCPEGETQYAHGGWRGPMILADPSIYVGSWIGQVATGDVNRDGTTDWVATIGCRYGLAQGTSAVQVLAFTRHGNDPYTLLGQVFVPGPNYDPSDPEVATDGSIRLVVNGPLEPAGAATSAWRSFRWDGSGFIPAGSPVAIPIPDPTQLTLTITPATVSGPSTTLSVTVHNGGPASSDYLQLSFSAQLLQSDASKLTSIAIRPAGLAADLKPFGSCQATADCSWAVRLEPVAAGESATGRFTVSFPSTIVGGSLFVRVTGVVRGAGSQQNATTGNVVTVPIAAG